MLRSVRDLSCLFVAALLVAALFVAMPFVATLHGSTRSEWRHIANLSPKGCFGVHRLLLWRLMTQIFPFPIANKQSLLFSVVH